MTKLAVMLKKARSDMGVTLREASQALGIAPSYLHAFENGNRKPPKMEMLYKIGGYYALNIDDLCIAAGRVPTDIFYKIIRCPELLAVIRDHKE